ncbi:AMP-binding protein [Lutimaribacter marinistellae]|uniref:AMP-binding protein n=1 Tax=Lutimaribacter marinistellae TaxID=1820329 RepID=A0ABV7TGY2_9RHOB
MTRPIDGLSHVRGSTERPLLDATIPGFLGEVCRRHGDRTACVFWRHGVRWSYADLARKVDQLAAGLLAIGVYKGDRVGIWAPNCPQWVLVQFATARIGAIMVNINPSYKQEELAHALRTAGVSTLITAEGHRDADYLAMLRALSPELARARPGNLRSAALPELRRVVHLGVEGRAGMYRFDEVMALGTSGKRARLDAITVGLGPHDAINIQFTSGTTGAPKGATLSHHNVLNNAISVARTMRLAPGDALCIPVPLYHCFGMVLGVLAAASYGVKMVFPDEGFDARSTLRALQDERCTAVHGVPTMFSAMLDDPDFARFDLRSLRTGIMAGAPCPEPLMRRVMQQMHCDEITIAYGMTETSPVSFQTAPDDPLERRVASVGRIGPHVEVRITDKDGAVLPVGQEGEVQTRGYLVMKGYWGDPERTSEVLQDGWMHTGDLGVIDEDGYAKITGRAGDMLIRGGENIYPAEVETVLLTHPGIAQAQVFGVPDERFGEEVAAWIIPRPHASLSAEDLQVWCRDRMARFKVPRHIRFDSEMPLTATGKAQKFRMSQILHQELASKKTSR